MASPTSRPLLPPILAIECSTKTPKSSLTGQKFNNHFSNSFNVSTFSVFTCIHSAGLIHHPQREAKELAVVCGLLSKFKAI